MQDWGKPSCNVVKMLFLGMLNLEKSFQDDDLIIHD